MRKRKTKAFIFDIDGTVADSEMRHLFTENIARGDWSWFKDRIPTFLPIEGGASMVRALKGQYQIIYSTVRSEKDREATIEWLEKYNLFDGILFMRPDCSKRLKDFEEKELHLKVILKDYNIVGVVDDNASCLEMYAKYNIPTYHFALNKIRTSE